MESIMLILKKKAGKELEEPTISETGQNGDIEFTE